MDEIKVKAQTVIDTLQKLTIISTFENMNNLMQCLQTLCEIRDYEPKADMEVKGDV